MSHSARSSFQQRGIVLAIDGRNNDMISCQ
jgi:hypothetical protein